MCYRPRIGICQAVHLHLSSVWCSSPVDKGLLLICWEKFCYEVLEVCDCLRSGTHIRLVCISLKRVVHATLCTNQNVWDKQQTLVLMYE